MAGAAVAERTAGQPVESFGKPGQGPGSFRRWIGMGGVHLTAEDFVGLANESFDLGTRNVGEDGRIMTKGLVVPGARDHLLNGLRKSNQLAIEGGFPVSGKDGEDMTFIFAGLNRSRRGGIVDLAEARTRVDTLVANIKPQTAGKNVERAAEEYIIVPFIPSGLEQSQVDLWGPTFGWDLPGVRQLQQDLNRNRQRKDRSQFGAFAVKLEDQKPRIVGAAVLEGRRFQGVFVGESTEWGVALSEKGKGIGPGVVAATHMQAIDTLNGTPHALLAELNTSSMPEMAPSAIVVGAKTGLRPFEMETAEGESIPQILPHHVGVGDGNPKLKHEIELTEGNTIKRTFPVRSFLLTYLPRSAELEFYGPEDGAYIRSVLQDGERRLAHAGYPRTRA